MALSSYRVLVAVYLIVHTWSMPLANGSGRANVDTPPGERYFKSVYCVGMAAGDDEFSLRIWCPPAKDLESAVLVRLGALASCLESPQELPITTAQSPDPDIVEILASARRTLDDLYPKLLPEHSSDPDYRRGYSAALEAELQQAIEAELSRNGLFERLRQAYSREFGRPDSCAVRMALWMEAQRNPVPPEEQWKRVIDVCAGPPDDLSRHIVFHFGSPGVAAPRIEAVRKLTQTSGFRQCLAESIRSRPELARRVRSLNGDTSAGEYVELRGLVHDLWDELGVPEVVDEVVDAGIGGFALKSLLEECARFDASSVSDEPGHPVVADEVLESVYRVYMAAGDTKFRLRVSSEPPEGLDEETFVRVASAAACLEVPHDLPLEVDLRPDPEFLVRIGRVRANLARLVGEIEPRHREDPDYDGSFSTALRVALQDALVPILRKEGVFRQVGAAYQQSLGRPESCMERLAADLSAPRGPILEAEQWKEVVDLCTGPRDSVGSHIVYHFAAEGVASARRNAILVLSGAPGFKACLVRIITNEPGLESRVLRFDGGTSYREATEIRSIVKDLWEEYGLAAAIEETGKSGSPGEAFYRFLSRCAELSPEYAGSGDRD